jgi:protein-S-isoprenylcysteine O-methyltransferase Ste14
MGRLLSSLLGLLFLCGLAYPVIAFHLALLPDQTGPRRVWLIILALFSLEKLIAMFFVIRRRFAPKLGTDWSMAATGYAYTAVLYGALAEFQFRHRPPDGLALAGLAVALAAIALRYSAVSSLRRAEAARSRESVLLTAGPFRIVRHPIYLAACVEAIMLPLAFQAPFTLVFSFLVFIPLQAHRARLEEVVLRREFGSDYDTYANHTPMLLPGCRKRRP